MILQLTALDLSLGFTNGSGRVARDSLLNDRCLPMSHLLLYYQRPEPATWVFLSSFLLFGLYFVFHRFWSLRNLDLVLLVLLAPGLMMVYEGRRMRADDVRPVSTSKLVSTQAQVDQAEGEDVAKERPNARLLWSRRVKSRFDQVINPGLERN